MENLPKTMVLIEGRPMVRGCQSCKHRLPGMARCTAFPDGIPSMFVNGDAVHDTPVEGDHGIQYEPGISEADRALARDDDYPGRKALPFPDEDDPEMAQFEADWLDWLDTKHSPGGAGHDQRRHGRWSGNHAEHATRQTTNLTASGERGKRRKRQADEMRESAGYGNAGGDVLRGGQQSGARGVVANRWGQRRLDRTRPKPGATPDAKPAPKPAPKPKPKPASEPLGPQASAAAQKLFSDPAHRKAVIDEMGRLLESKRPADRKAANQMLKEMHGHVKEILLENGISTAVSGEAVKFDSKTSQYGAWTPGANLLTMSAPLTKRQIARGNHEEIMDTLIHETIHSGQTSNLKGYDRTPGYREGVTVLLTNEMTRKYGIKAKGDGGAYDNYLNAYEGMAKALKVDAFTLGRAINRRGADDMGVAFEKAVNDLTGSPPSAKITSTADWAFHKRQITPNAPLTVDHYEGLWVNALAG